MPNCKANRDKIINRQNLTIFVSVLLIARVSKSVNCVKFFWVCTESSCSSLVSSVSVLLRFSDSELMLSSLKMILSDKLVWIPHSWSVLCKLSASKQLLRFLRLSWIAWFNSSCVELKSTMFAASISFAVFKYNHVTKLYDTYSLGYSLGNPLCRHTQLWSLFAAKMKNAILCTSWYYWSWGTSELSNAIQ